MSFVSWQYLLFLPAMAALYRVLPARGRRILLLVGSYFFYAFWDRRFLSLVLTSTLVDFFCGMAMGGLRVSGQRILAMTSLPAVWLLVYRFLFDGAVDGRIIGVAAGFPIFFFAAYRGIWRFPENQRRRRFLILSLSTHIGLLGFFKYFNFMGDSIHALLGIFGNSSPWSFFQIILPVGISFYTFQSISYTVDIFRGKARPTTDFITFAVYVAFFPQLLSGPIERSTELLPQLQREAALGIEPIRFGLRLILVGFFKKVFVADNCALLANYAFDLKSPLNGPWALLGVLAFAFQIYGDFSGYTDIARGSAAFFGIRLNRNFSFPYFSRGPSEFWRRWHITLSSWFRDYLYIPLGGNRAGRARTIRNTVITMLVAGLWHGAGWTFGLWGAYHAVLLILYREIPFLRKWSETEPVRSLKSLCAAALMFCFVLLGWGIFRCRNMDQLLHWGSALGNWAGGDALPWLAPSGWLAFHVAPLLLLQSLTWKSREESDLGHLSWPFRGLIYAVMFLLTSASTLNKQEFIYFQF